MLYYEKKLRFPALAVLFLLISFLVVYTTAVALANDGTGSEAGDLMERVDKIADVSGGQTLPPANCRYGAAAFDQGEFPALTQLGAGWTLNFIVNFNSNLPGNIEYVPVIRVKQAGLPGPRLPDYVVMSQPLNDNPGGLGPIIAANPGSLWLVGNEVDRIDVQDDIMPDIYAKAYHDIYQFIKARDQTAQVAISGLVEVTPGRLQYLDIVWDSYLQLYGKPMPVDVWNMHIYILPEKQLSGANSSAAVALGTNPAIAKLESYDPDGEWWQGGGPLNHSHSCPYANVICFAEHDDMNLFIEQARAMRQWMKDHGEQDKPLILSEFSLLFPYDTVTYPTCYLMDEFGKCFPPQRVITFMQSAFNYLETAADPNLGYPADNGRLVQQWLWFATRWGQYFASNLLDSGLQMNSIGTAFANWVAAPARSLYSNLVVDQIAYPVTQTITPTGTISTTLSIGVRNNGNTETITSTVMALYADQALTQMIGSTTVPAGLGGCARREYVTPPIVWNGLGTGLHPYWITLEGNIAATGFVLVNPKQVYLPITNR